MSGTEPELNGLSGPLAGVSAREGRRAARPQRGHLRALLHAAARGRLPAAHAARHAARPLDRLRPRAGSGPTCRSRCWCRSRRCSRPAGRSWSATRRASRCCACRASRCSCCFRSRGRAPTIEPGHALYRLLIAYDGASNAFPSLHAGLAVFSLLFAYRVTCERPRPPRSRRPGHRRARSGVRRSSTRRWRPSSTGRSTSRPGCCSRAPPTRWVWRRAARAARPRRAPDLQSLRAARGRRTANSVQTPMPAATSDRYWPGVQPK